MDRAINVINIAHRERQQTGYLEICYNSCIEFQSKIRRSGIKSFSVWAYLEDCFKENWKSKYRKPPRANTILHWFEDDPITGMKMGAEDFAQICQFVDDYSPLIAYHEEMIARFENVNNDQPVDSKKKIEIKDSALELADNAGSLCGEIKSALSDGRFMPHEKKDVAKAISTLKNKIKTLEVLVK